MTFSTTTVKTKPYEGQKPGTSGLRKKVKVFQQENYLANFIQSLFDALSTSALKGRTILVGGDGRYWSTEAIQIIADIAAANGIGKLLIGVNGWVSTPAASAIIRSSRQKCYGGILLTASHNPGGPEEDFGVKYNMENGGPAPESVTDAIYRRTCSITEYRKTGDHIPIDVTKLGLSTFDIEGVGKFEIEVIDPFEDWVALMKDIFDFKMLKDLIHDPRFSFVYDGLNGIAGPYAKKIFIEELGADPKCLIQCESLPDFGGCHPDPNLTYAKKLVDTMAVLSGKADSNTPEFGAAGDGDNDRNMILGKGWFVTPSDSVAIIAAYAMQCIPYFMKKGIKGVSRSMPTSMALKNVADKLKFDHYEVPTGWKYFGNLMDAGRCNICGEESFGTGSDHIREKDGLWAVLAWLSILSYRNKDKAQPFVSVKQINEEFWKEYGRNYYTRYDYENIPSGGPDVLDYVSKLKAEEIKGQDEISRKFLQSNPVIRVDIFNYIDAVDQSVSNNQGVRVYFKDGSRFVLRLSGTGSTGATVRLYLEKYERQKLDMQTAEALQDLVHVALELCQFEKFTSRNHPTVIT